MQDSYMFIGAGIFYIVWCLINFVIAKAKNVEPGTVLLLSIFFTPLLGYLYVHAMPDDGK